AYRYQNDYLRVIWINAQSRETIVTDVGKLARELNTPGCDDKDQAIMLNGFLRWLGRQQRWLLLFDNVEDLSLLQEYIPEGNQGHILLTTRQQAVSGEIRRISIDEMDPETGGYFLLKRAKKIEADAALDTVPAEEMLQAKVLSAMLGGLPLALDQAGGFIERTRCSLSRYMQLYEKEHARLLAEHGFPGDTTKYAETVATTWSLSFERVAQAEEVGPAAADLLRMCAFLAADSIPLRLFEAVAEADFGVDVLGSTLAPVAAQPLQMEKTIEVLMRYSLMRREENVLSIHRLVQTVLRDAMSEQERFLWAGRATELINGIFPDPLEVESWPACHYLLPHALVCYQWIVQANIQTEDAAKLLHRVGHYLITQGVYGKDEWLLKQTLEICRKVQGEEHPDTAASLLNLAQPLYEKALEIMRKVRGEEHPDTIVGLGNLAALYEAQDRYEEAEPLYEKALEMSRRVVGEEHPNTVIHLNNLAGLYRLRHRYGEAELCYKKALEIIRKVLGNGHPFAASVLNNLAVLYGEQGRYKEAEPLYKQSLEISLLMLGEEHPNTVESLDNLAGLYEAQGRYEEAEPLREQVLKIQLKVLGEEHLDLARYLHSLAKLYAIQERYEEAEPLLEQAASILIHKLGKEHGLTKVFIENYRVCKDKRIKKQKKQ
ncbi:MAG TPA: FxSxx-COOH system tetratricopeptide repeat protein, partial [Ktedonobacteraceae bacterium]